MVKISFPIKFEVMVFTDLHVSCDTEHDFIFFGKCLHICVEQTFCGSNSKTNKLNFMMRFIQLYSDVNYGLLTFGGNRLLGDTVDKLCPAFLGFNFQILLYRSTQIFMYDILTIIKNIDSFFVYIIH